MIKLVILAFAYLLYAFVDSVEADKYYFYCSAVYSTIALASFYAYVKSNSLMLLSYMTVNYLYSLLHFAVNYGNNYELLRGIIWHNSINFSLILTMIEVMLLLGGVASVLIFIINLHITDNVKHTSVNNRMVHTK